MRKIVKNTSSGQRAQQLINPTKDKKGSKRGYQGYNRVRRSGNWYWDIDPVGNSYSRMYLPPTRQPSTLGFRLVRNAS